MKTITRFAFLTLAIALMISCKPNPVQTIENLKAAYNGESTASMKYAAFAERATQEGFDTVAVMFKAASKAEAIHANNHKKTLEKLGVTVEGPQIGSITVLSTAENLADAIKGETYEIETMYPGFIETAKTEKSSDANKSFTWAIDTEKKHADFYKTALAALNGGGEKSLAVSWFVCPVCGNTFNVNKVPEKCDFCMTSKEKFLTF